LERVLSAADKVIIDQPGGAGVMPFLPLAGVGAAQGGARK